MIMMQDDKGFEDICRLCALACNGGVDIYSAQGESTNMEHKIITYLHITVCRNDKLPKSVCFSCKLQLDEVYQFCCQAANAQETLSFLINIPCIDQGNTLPENVKLENSAIKSELEENSEVDRNYSEWKTQPSIEPGELVENLNECNQASEQGRNVSTVLRRRKKERKSKAASIQAKGFSVPDAGSSMESQIEQQPGEVTEEDSDKGLRDWSIACPACPGIFPSRQEFEDHCRIIHGENLSYSCSQCDKQLENFKSYCTHYYRHVSKFPCPYCDKTFTLEGPLRTHVLSRHVPVRPFACQLCDKSYVTQAGLDRHHKQLHDQQQEFQCTQCQKILKTRGGLGCHMATHRFGRRFQCHLCGKTFTQRSNMQEHVKGHLEHSKQFSCNLCYKSFSKKSHLKRHMVFHTQERPFDCTVCSKTFKTERCLKMHTQTHEETKTLVCSECGKAFRNISKLKIHFNRHSGDRPYACDVCGKKFADYSNAQKHSMRCHQTNQGRMKTELERSQGPSSLQPLIALDLLGLPEIKVKDDLFLFDTDGTTDRPTDPFLTDFNVSSTDFAPFQLSPNGSI